MAIRLTTTVRNSMLAIIRTAVDAGAAAGTLEIRTGTPPVNADAAATGTVLVTFALADPSFENPASGSMAIDADPDLVGTAVAGGTATWARVKDSDGNTIFDGLVGTSGTNDFVITNAAVTAGQTVTVTTGSINLPAS